jgi:hypothetical protein
MKELTKREVGKIKTFLRNLCYEVPYGFSTFIKYEDISNIGFSYEYKISIELNKVNYEVIKWEKTDDNPKSYTQIDLPIEELKTSSEIIQKIGKRKILEILLKDIDRYIKDCNKCKEYILKYRRK